MICSDSDSDNIKVICSDITHLRAVIAVKMRKVRLTMREKEGETVPKKGALPTFNWTSPGELYFGILNIVCGDKIL